MPGARVVVLGLDASGQSVARALEAGGATALCWDDDEQTRANAEAEGVALCDLTRRDVWDGVDRLIIGPDVSPLYPDPNRWVAAAMAAGVPVDNALGLFFRSLAEPEWDRFDVAPRVIAVAGSRRRSKAAAFIHHGLLTVGRESQLAGADHSGVLDIVPPGDGGAVVVELSEPDIALARALTPDIGVFTDFAPHDTEQHGGIGGTFAAMRRLFAEGGPDRAVIALDDAEGRYLANSLAEGGADDRVIKISAASKLDGPGWVIFVRKGFLAEYRKGRQVASVDLRQMSGISDPSDQICAAAAFAVLRTMGAAPKAIEKVFSSFARQLG
jgi:UDP-N-acetylmuramoylalanine--D-glutamate ligase